MSSPFSITILNASGAILGNGPVITAKDLTDTRTLDRIGTLSFSMPANDPRYALITEGSQFDIYDEQDGYLGRYIFKLDDLSETKQRGTVRIDCYDALRELVHIPTGMRRQYTFTAVETVAASLMGLAPGWTQTLDTGIGNTTITFESESVLSALDALCSRWNMHYRLSNVPVAKTLEFGAFGAASGLLITNLEGQIQSDINMRTWVAAVDTIERTRDADWIINTIVPLGAGQGINQLTIEGATLGDYPVLLSPNFDGTNMAYIQDAASKALYGQRLHQVSFSQITPLSNNATDILRAKNALKLTAETLLKKHLAPNTQYKLSVNALRQAVKVGDTVHLRYQGTDRNNVYLDVDADFYVTEITRRRSALGRRGADLTISSVNDRRQSDTDVIVDVIHDVKALKVYYQPEAFRESHTYIDTVSAFAGGAGSYIGGLSGTKPAVFQITIDKTVTQVNKVLIRFRTYNHSVVADVAQVPSANEYFWSTSVSKYFPKNLHLYVDSIDVSNQFGGPWNSGNTDAAVDVTLDITTLIQNAAGGVYQQHPIWITAGSGTASGSNEDVSVNSGHPTLNQSDTSFGMVELTTTVQGSSTGIIAT